MRRTAIGNLDNLFVIVEQGMRGFAPRCDDSRINEVKTWILGSNVVFRYRLLLSAIEDIRPSDLQLLFLGLLLR